MSEQRNPQSPPSILIAGGRDLVSVLDRIQLPGAEIFVAGDGAGAICELLTNVYDAALIDDTLPRVDGLRLIALIRSTSKIASLPILAVVEAGDERSRLEAIRVGADAALMKPVEVPALLESIERMLAHRP